MRHGVVVLVSVVVVVTGLRVVVSCEVLVVVREALSEAQPVSDASDKRAAAARQGRMNFFISVIGVWLVNLQAPNYGIGGLSAMGCNPTVRLIRKARRKSQTGNIQQTTSNAQHPKEYGPSGVIGCSMLNVRCSMFSGCTDTSHGRIAGNTNLASGRFESRTERDCVEDQSQRVASGSGLENFVRL